MKTTTAKHIQCNIFGTQVQGDLFLDVAPAIAAIEEALPEGEETKMMEANVEFSEISYNAIHYIWLKAGKAKTSDKLKSAINAFHKKHSNTSNMFLTYADTHSSKEELRKAYIEYAKQMVVETQHKYRTPEQALEIIAKCRFLLPEELV